MTEPMTEPMTGPITASITKAAHVSAIYISPVATQLPEAVDQVRAIAGAGLEGDRYCAESSADADVDGDGDSSDGASGRGTWSRWPGGGRQVTLIEAEVLAELEATLGVTGAETRRNIVTSGVKLNDLVGVDFTVGEVMMRGVRLCEPCAHIEKLTVRGVALALDNCGGLRADILQGGIVFKGDKLERILDR